MKLRRQLTKLATC